MTSSPLRADASLKEQLDWYRTEYALLETDLADYKASSKELEEQLEKDVENLEKNERKWKEQIEKLNFEVEEWKTKHKQSKAEANSAQNALQKEVTTMRESNRSLQLRLRDTEVMNDDYERQARHTESSLEDMETKHNAAIERGVLLEEEIRLSEQDREALRIEAQRLRDELGDLKVESDITQEKLRLAESTIESLRTRKPSPLAVETLRARSPASETSGFTPLSPTASTPPPKSDANSEMQTPPSPPLSDAPLHGKAEQRTPVPFSRTSVVSDSAPSRKPLHGLHAQSRHTRGPSTGSNVTAGASDAKSMRPPMNRSRPSRSSAVQGDNLPRSESLVQIRGLIGRMQKIEERVHSARSKLPAPSNTTPRNSPRTGTTLVDSIPSSITVRRSTAKRSSATSSILQENETTPSADSLQRRESRVKRLSYGIPRPTSVATSRSDMLDRPPSALDRPSSVAGGASRPSSRASMAAPTRPESRSGARTELGHHSSSTYTADGRRPRSSVGGNYATMHSTTRSHRPSASVSELRRKAETEDPGLVTPSRRTTLDKSTLPTPSAASRRQSGGIPSPTKPINKRISTSFSQVKEERAGEMKPPPRKRTTDVGETF